MSWNTWLAGALAVAALLAGAGAATARPGGWQRGNPRVAGEPDIAQRADLESRMRILRADASFKETKDAAEEMTKLVADLSAHVVETGTLAEGDAKTLDRIKKLAKRVRSDLGGSGDAKLENAPKTAKDAATALADRASKFEARFTDGSRYGTDARLIALTGEIAELASALKSLGAR